VLSSFEKFVTFFLLSVDPLFPLFARILFFAAFVSPRPPVFPPLQPPPNFHRSWEPHFEPRLCGPIECSNPFPSPVFCGFQHSPFPLFIFFSFGVFSLSPPWGLLCNRFVAGVLALSTSESGYLEDTFSSQKRFFFSFFNMSAAISSRKSVAAFFISRLQLFFPPCICLLWGPQRVVLDPIPFGGSPHHFFTQRPPSQQYKIAPSLNILGSSFSRWPLHFLNGEGPFKFPMMKIKCTQGFFFLPH